MSLKTVQISLILFGNFFKKSLAPSSLAPSNLFQIEGICEQLSFAPNGESSFVRNRGSSSVRNKRFSFVCNRGSTFIRNRGSYVVRWPTHGSLSVTKQIVFRNVCIKRTAKERQKNGKTAKERQKNGKRTAKERQKNGKRTAKERQKNSKRTAKERQNRHAEAPMRWPSNVRLLVSFQRRC